MPRRAQRPFPDTPLAIEPVRRHTVMEMVARRIESLIRSGELRCGDRLPPEPELARILRISRSSLREALKGLLFLGLIKSRPGSGTFIQPTLTRVLSRHFQWMVLLEEMKHLEIYELRRIVEPEAAALAAQRATAEDIDRMERALAAMRLSVDKPEDFHKHDIEFHGAFAQASGNLALQTTMSVLYDAANEARLRVLPLIENMKMHWKRHEQMFFYIRDRKPQLARKAVLQDILYAEALLRHEPEIRRDKEQKKKSTRNELVAQRVRKTAALPAAN